VNKQKSLAVAAFPARVNPTNYILRRNQGGAHADSET
jgi:hypothetical protein